MARECCPPIRADIERRPARSHDRARAAAAAAQVVRILGDPINDVGRGVDPRDAAARQRVLRRMEL